MNYTDFELEFLIAIYSVSEEAGEDMVNVGRTLKRSKLAPKPNWVPRALASFINEGWAKDVRTLDEDEEQDVWLTAAGVKKAEQLLQTRRVVFDADDFDSADFDTGDEEAAPSVQSENWTGISERLTASQKTQLRELATSLVALIQQSDLDARSAKNATKHVEAIQSLLEAPDPPWKAIVDLLNHPAVMAFLAAKEILAIIWSAAS